MCVLKFAFEENFKKSNIDVMDDLEALEDIEDLEDDIFFSSDDDDHSDHSGGDFVVQRGITLLINFFCRAASYTVQHLFSLIQIFCLLIIEYIVALIGNNEIFFSSEM